MCWSHRRRSFICFQLLCNNQQSDMMMPNQKSIVECAINTRLVIISVPSISNYDMSVKYKREKLCSYNRKWISKSLPFIYNHRWMLVLILCCIDCGFNKLFIECRMLWYAIYQIQCRLCESLWKIEENFHIRIPEIFFYFVVSLLLLLLVNISFSFFPTYLDPLEFKNKCSCSHSILRSFCLSFWKNLPLNSETLIFLR